MTEESLRKFSSVYETKEYKTLAYEGVSLEEVGQDKFSWKDGVISQTMKIEAEEKEELLKRYKEDVFRFQMERVLAEFLKSRLRQTEKKPSLSYIRFLKKHAISLKAGGLIRKNR